MMNMSVDNLLKQLGWNITYNLNDKADIVSIRYDRYKDKNNNITTSGNAWAREYIVIQPVRTDKKSFLCARDVYGDGPDIPYTELLMLSIDELMFITMKIKEMKWDRNHSWIEYDAIKMSEMI